VASLRACDGPTRVNPYYQSGEARAGRVQDLFGEIAPRYDLINDLQSFGLHRAWKRKVVELAAVQPGMMALDVCCGTGDIAFGLEKHGARVVGLDFSVPMLRAAAAQIEGSLSLLQGDAQQLPFPDDAFDAVTAGYGLRNLASWQRGLREMWRVAKPGGRVLVLEFGKPPNALWRALYFAYLRGAVPIFGRLFCNNAPAYAYIYESLQHYAGQRGVADYMRELGCRDACVINLVGGAMSINMGVK
jgi:demethylmenaquinone methyltransferase / 2-methoxy-6-polyprenyl-1,4-benzoquinol methylase